VEEEEEVCSQLISFSGRENAILDGLEMGTEGLKKRRWDHDK